MILTKTCDIDLDHVGETPEISAPRVFNQLILVGGLDHFCFFFPYIGNVIIPTDELIFFRGVGQPPTSISVLHYCQLGM